MSSAKCLFSWFLSLGSSTFKAIACTVGTIVLAAVMIVWVLCIWKSNKNEKTMREFIVKSYCWSLPSLSQDCSVNTPLERPSVDFAPAPSNDYRLASVYQNLIQNQHPTLEKGSSTVTSHGKTVTVPGKKKNLQRQSHTLLQSISCVIVYDDVPYFHVNLNFLKFKKYLKLYRYCINI